MTGTAVAPAPSNLPALVPTPANTITSDDIALPRVYIGQFMSQHVQDKVVNPGAIYVAQGADDPDPQVLHELGDPTGVTFHALSLRKGLSYSQDGELQLYDFGDPNAPEGAWTTYNYIVVLPEHDPDVPAKWLLTRTGRPAAQQINMVLKKNESKGPAYINAFTVTTAERKNAKGKYFVARVAPAEASAANLEVVSALAAQVSGPYEAPARNDEPAI
jgi:hypothetical protein